MYTLYLTTFSEELHILEKEAKKMYRSKLQELCQQKRWALPKYSCMKDGPDHNPRFKASVIVSGINFDTETICKSSKEAYNEAAKHAFLHFTSGYNQSSDQEEAHQSPKVYPHTLDTKPDSAQGYKLKLQIYAQRKNLGLPLYHCKREGPPHALCFKAIVTIAGESFESQEVYKNIKDAEAAAAQAALLSLSTDAFRGNNTNLYKNLLQELTQSEGLFFPTYKTIRSGDPHDLTFTSTVEVEGETFCGKVAKSKKQSELNAAMVAYTAITERKSSQTGEFSHTSSEGEVVKVAPQSDSLTAADPQENSKSEYPSVITSVIRDELHVKQSKGEDEDIDSTEKSLNTKSSPQEAITHSLPLDAAELSGNRNSDASLEPLCFSPEESQSSSAMMTLPDLSALSISDSSMKNTTEINSYLLCSRVRVYTCIPDIALTKGTVLLPIAENKWVAVSLEFTN